MFCLSESNIYRAFRVVVENEREKKKEVIASVLLFQGSTSLKGLQQHGRNPQIADGKEN